MGNLNAALAVAGACDAAVALLHVLIIFGGGPWYRFFGAGERMAAAAEAGRAYPALVTLGIALVFAAWGAYAFAAAGVLPLDLPLARNILVLISAIYLLRALGLPAMVLANGARPRPFDLWSSACSGAFGLAHLLGLIQVWQTV